MKWIVASGFKCFTVHCCQDNERPGPKNYIKRFRRHRDAFEWIEKQKQERLFNTSPQQRFISSLAVGTADFREVQTEKDKSQNYNLFPPDTETNACTLPDVQRGRKK